MNSTETFRMASLHQTDIRIFLHFKHVMICAVVRTAIATSCTSRVHMGEEGAAGVCMNSYVGKSICQKSLPEIFML